MSRFLEWDDREPRVRYQSSLQYLKKAFSTISSIGYA